MALQVKDLTLDQLKALIRETVRETLASMAGEIQAGEPPLPLRAEARAIARLSSLDDPSQLITSIDLGEEIDETSLNDWLTTRGYAVQNSD